MNVLKGTDTCQMVEYKSGCVAEAAWMNGHYSILTTFCPHRM